MNIDPVSQLIVGGTFVGAADRGGKFPKPPVGIVLHYTASSTMSSAERQLTQKDQTYVSAHALIDKTGEIHQLVRFDYIAYHAGESRWKGLYGVNAYMLGIELVNPGYVDKKQVAGWPVELRQHKNGGPTRAWYAYPDAQVQACAELCKALKAHYPSIVEVIGHDDVAPARKVDPGPAWNWSKFRALTGF